MGQMADWYADIARAAEELGYIVESIDYRSPGRVVLTPKHGHDSEQTVLEGDERVALGGVFLTGATLRARLRSIDGPTEW